jgi:hypothetical protein
MSFALPNDKLPFNMVCKTVETCINNVQGTTPIEKTENMLVYAYQIDTHICKLYTDQQKRFIKLVVNEEELLTFSDFQYL